MVGVMIPSIKTLMPLRYAKAGGVAVTTISFIHTVAAFSGYGFEHGRYDAADGAPCTLLLGSLMSCGSAVWVL